MRTATATAVRASSTGRSHARPAAQGGARVILLRAQSAYGQGATLEWLAQATVSTPGQPVPSKPDYRPTPAGVTAGRPPPKPFTSGGLGYEGRRCKATRARVAFLTQGLTGGRAAQLGDELQCIVPRSLMVRVRAVFREPVELEVVRRSYSAVGRIEQGQVAVRTTGGKPLVYADVTDSGRARLFTRRDAYEGAHGDRPRCHASPARAVRGLGSACRARRRRRSSTGRSRARSSCAAGRTCWRRGRIRAHGFGGSGRSSRTRACAPVSSAVPAGNMLAWVTSGKPTATTTIDNEYDTFDVKTFGTVGVRRETVPRDVDEGAADERGTPGRGRGADSATSTSALRRSRSSSASAQCSRRLECSAADRSTRPRTSPSAKRSSSRVRRRERCSPTATSPSRGRRGSSQQRDAPRVDAPTSPPSRHRRAAPGAGSREAD